MTASFGHEYWPVSLIGRSRGVRVLLFRHLNSRLKRSSAAVLPRVADAFVAVSESVKAHLRSSGVCDQHVRVLYNPIDTGFFVPAREEERARIRGELGIPPGAFVVGFIGSFGPVKGASFLSASLNGVMRRHANVVALWVGEADRRGTVRSQISPEHERRHFFFEWSSDVRPFYRAMDVLAVPSQWQEPFGRVAVEAAACGVPVVASRVGGLPEAVIDGSTGWIVPPDDARAWSDTLSRLVDSPDELQRAGAAGQAFVSDRFGLERIGADFERLLQ